MRSAHACLVCLLVHDRHGNDSLYGGMLSIGVKSLSPLILDKKDD
jgi:hypothetical protein